MLLKRLEVRNMRKIKQAEIDFYGPGVQVIQGINQSGKTTLAQSIALTMNGSRDFTPGMVRHGEEKAEIFAWTDDGLQIRTVVTDGVKQTVQKYNNSLGKLVNVSGGVRAFLNSICSGLEMPWALRDMTDAKIIEMVKDRSGITEKIAAIDAELKEKESQRAEAGRDKKRMGEPAMVLQAKHPAPIDTVRAEREKAAEYLKWREMTMRDAEDYVRGKCRFEDWRQIEALADDVRALAGEIAAKFENGRAYTQADIDALDKEISWWYEAERQAADFDRYMAAKDEWNRLAILYDDLTAEIETLRAQRKKALSGMKLGVKGLEIGEDNCLYHNGAVRGITETQKTGNWSTAESVQVFFGLGARFSGDMKMLVVDNAESLDLSTTAAIAKWAESAGFLVIMLKVAEVPEELEEGIVYIREGEIVTK